MAERGTATMNWQQYHWHLEPSSVCSLACPRCPRTEHPDTPWLNMNMDLDFIKKLFTEEMLRNKVKRITMCGDVGDPIYCPQYLDIYEYIKSVNPKIHIFTITNGSHKKVSWWERFASLANEYDSINFGIDGYDDASNNLYRVNSKWDSIMDAITTMRSNNKKVFLHWALIVFKFNQHKLKDIENLAKDLGMDSLQITKSTKFGCKYGDAYGGTNDTLEPDQEHISRSHRYERYSINLSKRQLNNSDYIEHNRKMWKKIASDYNESWIKPLCEIGNRAVYVNAEGVVHPCSWMSFPYDSLTDGWRRVYYKDSFFAKYRDRMNIRNRSLEEVFNDPLWNKISDKWTSEDRSKIFVECNLKCNTIYVTEDTAVGWETN